MTFVIKKVSDHGTTNPIVARLSIQTSEIIKFFQIEQEARDHVLNVYLNHLQPRLLNCNDIAISVKNEYDQIMEDIVNDKISQQPGGRVIELPQVNDLINRAETFLYHAKSSLRDIAKIFEPLFDEEITHSRYNDISKMLAKKYGVDAPLVKLLQDDEAWIKDVIDMRNTVEHPASKLGPLQILNVELVATNESGQRFFQGPVWFLNGEEPFSIPTDMNVITDNILRFAEDLLIASYIQLHPDSAIQFAEIPENERNPDSPIRLRAVLDKSKIKSKDK